MPTDKQECPCCERIVKVTLVSTDEEGNVLICTYCKREWKETSLRNKPKKTKK